MLRKMARRLKKTVVRRLAAFRPTKTYHDHHADTVLEYRSLKGAKVLVVGCNSGEDCKLFVDRGASEIQGVDVIEGIGHNFQHGKVRYLRAGIEDTGLPDDYFDVVFAVATMEHVPDIKAGFAEMVRVTKPGGLIYSVAAPLWQSPYGHHMACFDAHPWIHLAFKRNELIAYAQSHGIDGERGHTIEAIVDYMLNPDFFNMKPGNEFIEACSGLRGLENATNELLFESDALLAHPLGQKVLAMGFTKESLLAVTHNFIARKLG